MNSPIALILWSAFWYCRLAVAIRVPVSYDDAPIACPGSTPSKAVLCYYEGHIALERLDPCLCSHLILTSVATINPHNYTLNLTTDLKKVTRELRRRNSDLQVLASVGGLRVPVETAEALVKSADRRAAFASSVAQNIRDADLNGIELDFRLEARRGSKYSKGGLVSLAKLLRKEMGVERSHRSRRDYAVFEQVDDISTTAWTPPRRYGTRDARRAETGTRVPHRTILRSVRTDRVNHESELFRQWYLSLEQTSPNNLLLLITVPTQPEVLVKRFDLKTLTKYVDFFTISSHNLTDYSENGVTYHPSRLMGIADLLNTDSLLDLVMGLGAPPDKLIISIPATALRFTLTDAKQNTPRSPAVAGPVQLTQTELCSLISAGGWTIERDEDLTAPYAFKNNTWLAFDDNISVGIKSKYVLLRDLAGAALHTVDSADWSGACMEDNSTESKAPRLLHRLHHAFTALARKSRGALLETLQEDIRTSTLLTFTGDVHLSPYRIVRVIDNQGAVHVVRKDARTEFECSRQGYFRHPLGCNRFYRCVKFDQYSADFTVFEYDCPAGLAFDERWEVCVWPGSLPEGACRGSSEIAPVPRARYNCPRTEGYYADPENCRWFFACLDHARDGLTPLTAYEFRCPFGLVFDEQHLLCQWPWLVDGCGNSGLFAGSYFGAVAYGDATRRGYVSAAGGHVASGVPVSPTSGSTFVTTGDLGLRSGVGLTSGTVPTVLQNGAVSDVGYGTAGILLTDANTGGNVGASSTYFAEASRGNVKYSGSAAGGGEFGGQIAKSYLLALKDTDSLSNAGSYNEGRHISSYASFPDSYVSGGRIENSDGYVLGEHFGIHRIGSGFGVRSGVSSATSGTRTAGITTGTGSGNAKISYSSSDDGGEYFSGSVLTFTPTQTVVKSPNIPVIPVTTLKKPAVTQIPIVQPIATYQQTVVETPQAPVVPVTTFTRPAVVKVQSAAVPVGTYQQTVVETPQSPVVPVTTFTRPAVVKVQSAAVPVGTYEQTVVETPQAPVVPVTTFTRPAVVKVQSAAVPVGTYQQTVVETPQAPVVPVTTFTRPAVVKVQSAAVPVGTYQQTVVETPQAPVVPVTTFTRPAVVKVQSAAVPVGTYQQTVVETPQAPVVPVTTFTRPAVVKVQSAAVPVGTYQQTVVETPQAPVVPVTTFTRPAVVKVQSAAVPVGTYQQTVVETPQAPVVPVTTFTRPAVVKVQSAAVPVGTYQQTVVETPQAPVVPVTTFTSPAVVKVQSAAVPVGTYQQTVVETPVTAAVPIYAAVSPIQQAASVTPHVRKPTVSQTSIVDTPPVKTYLAETPTAPAVLTRTRLQPVSYQAPNIPAAKPIVPVVNTYLSTPVPTVAPIPSDFAETGSPRLRTGDENEEHSFHRRPSISVATDGAAGISIPLLRSNVDNFGVVVNDNTAQVTPAPVIKNSIFLSTTPATNIFTSSLVPFFSSPINSSSGHVSSTTVPSIYIGSSIPIDPVVKSQTATGHYSYFGPAPAIFTGTPPSVTPVPILQSHVSSGSFGEPAVPSVRYSYSSSAPTVVTSGAVSFNAGPLLRPNGEPYSFQSSGTVTGDTIPITNTRVTPAGGYSYPKPYTPFITGTAANFRGFPLDSGLGSAVLDRSTGLVSGLEIPSSTAGTRTISSEVISRKPYTNGVGASTFISTPTSNTGTVNSHENMDVPSSATVSPDTFIPISHTANQKAVLLSTVEPIHSVSFYDGHFGARTYNEHSKSAASYPGAVGREKFIPQNNVTYRAPLATVHTAGSAFTYDADQAHRQGRPYSGHVSTIPLPVTAAPGPSATFISSTTRPLTYTSVVSTKSYATVSPAVKTTYMSSALPVESVTSAPVLQSTSSEYKNLEEYGLRVGQFASRRKPTSTMPTSYDNENVEALLDKYSEKFGGLLDNNKEGFITEVITDDLADRGRSRVSQGGIGDTLQRGNVKSVGLSDMNDRYAAIAGYNDEGSNSVFGIRTGFSTTPATSTGSSNSHYATDGTYISTTASTSRGESRGKTRYGSNVDTDADGGIGYEAITVEREDTKSRSKEAPVVVITRLSDVNPLLVAKLGAQCTCKSNTVTLKRPDGYSRGGNSGNKLLPISSPTLQDDITSRSEIYKVPEHVPAAPLPGSNIVTGTSPDIILGLNDEISPSTFVNFDPVSFSVPKANKFLKAIGLDETGFTPTPAVLATTFRPHSKLSEVTHTTAKPVKITAPVPASRDVRPNVRLDVVSTPLAPLLEVSPSIPTTVSVTSRSRAHVPLVVSTTAVPIPVAGVPGLRRVASVSGGHPKTGCPDSSVEVAGSARDLDVKTDGRAPGVAGGVAIGAGRSFDRYGPGGWRALDETLQGSVDCQRAGLFRHPKYCNKFYACHWDEWKGRYTLHVFNCPVHLAYDSSLGACNWPSEGPACTDNTLLV